MENLIHSPMTNTMLQSFKTKMKISNHEMMNMIMHQISIMFNLLIKNTITNIKLWRDKLG